MVEITQLSDLHFGSEFRDDYFDNIISFIKKNRPDAVLVTGDIVHKGRFKQFEAFMPYLDKLKEVSKNFIAIPGNHDAKSSGLIQFERFIGPRRSKLIIEEKDTLIVGVCTARDDSPEGLIGDEQLDWLGRQFNKNLENRVIALHHHTIGVPYSGRKHNTYPDAGELIEFTQIFGVDLVCHGHKHVPHAYVIGPTTFLYCGTSTSDKVRAAENPSFNHISLNEGDIEVQLINSEDLEQSLLLQRKENHTKFVRPRRTRIEHLLGSPVWDD